MHELVVSAEAAAAAKSYGGGAGPGELLEAWIAWTWATKPVPAHYRWVNPAFPASQINRDAPGCVVADFDMTD